MVVIRCMGVCCGDNSQALRELFDPFGLHCYDVKTTMDEESDDENQSAMTMLVVSNSLLSEDLLTEIANRPPMWYDWSDSDIDIA